MKSWNVALIDAGGRALVRVTVDASTRRAARVAGFFKGAQVIGRRAVDAVRATAHPAGDPARTLARKLRRVMSARMAWTMGGILGHDFGATDSHGNRCGRITVTSDGFALGAMGNAFIGAESDIRRNFDGILDHVGATAGERAYAESRYRENVKRWDSV